MEASPFDHETWQKQLAEASGVSEYHLKNVIEGKWKLTEKTAEKLAPHLFHEDT